MNHCHGNIKSNSLEIGVVKGRLIAIGDIHGHLSSINQLLKKINPIAEDKIIFLGDYISNGPDSCGVIELLIALKKTFPQSIFLKGNHEQMFLEYLSGKNKIPFLANGGHSTLKTYNSSGKIEIPNDHYYFFENLELFHEEKDFVFVHAGLKPGIKIPENDQKTMLWIRNEFFESDYNWGKVIVFGHTPFERPFLGKNKIGLNCDVDDTGVVVGCDVEKGLYWFSDDQQ